jgi:cell division protein FtsW
VRRSAAPTPKKAQKRPDLRLIAGTLGQRVAESAHRSKVSAKELSQRDGARLLVLSGALTVFGLVMVLSASPVASINAGGTPWSLFEKQAMWAVIGAVGCVVGIRINLRRLRQFSIPLLVGSGLLLIAVLVPGIGTTVGGSSRWIGFGPFRIQPSEFSKIGFAIFIADLVARRERGHDSLREIVRPAMIALGIMGILILKQPDMGTAVVLACIAGAVLFAAGIDRRILLVVMSSFLVLGAILSLDQAYRRARFLAFLHPFSNPTGSSYQIVQSLVALGSGHLTGTGIGGSVAKWDLLPNAWTDFIFAIIGNELGLVGALAVIVAFVVFAFFGIRIAKRCRDRFCSLLAVAITCWIVAQAFINIGGVESALPETGIPLPFVSSGGSSLVVALFAVGLLHNIANHGSIGRSAVPRSASPAAKVTSRRITAQPSGAGVRSSAARVTRAGGR